MWIVSDTQDNGMINTDNLNGICVSNDTIEFVCQDETIYWQYNNDEEATNAYEQIKEMIAKHAIVCEIKP